MKLDLSSNLIPWCDAQALRISKLRFIQPGKWDASSSANVRRALHKHLRSAGVDRVWASAIVEDIIDMARLHVHAR